MKASVRLSKTLLGEETCQLSHLPRNICSLCLDISAITMTLSQVNAMMMRVKFE